MERNYIANIYNVETREILQIVTSDSQKLIERYSTGFDSDLYSLTFSRNELINCIETIEVDLPTAEQLAEKCIEGAVENKRLYDGEYSDWEDAQHIIDTYCDDLNGRNWLGREDDALKIVSTWLAKQLS